MPRARDLPAQALAPVPGAAALLAAYFRALVAEAEHLDRAAAETATDVLAQLALMARGLATPDDEIGMEAIRAGRLLAARQFIEHNLHRPALSPAAAAAALGISPRLLHLLFEPTGTSFARYLLERRLERARLLLGRHPQRSVYDVALACGIEIAADAAFAQQMSADDLKWINQCIRDNARPGPSPEVVRKYCICMNEKMDDNETRTITQWERANPKAMADCDRVSGWK